ncbi:MAG TPA: FAD-containing oxidoreductase [Candidatus Acidoferrum sp.]|nr:FAD-containing oxidoreductase [Candidatus Acidoferrum sp.]
MSAFDAIVIGTGQSGPSLAVRLAKAGRKVAVIERHLIGGTCVNTGCIPTKTLVASARTAHVARRAADYGVIVEGGVRVDMAAVKARKEHVLMQSRTGVEQWLEDTPGCTLIRGHARFTGDHEVTVNDQQLTAPEIFINVGARAAVPPLPGLDRVPYLTNTSILELDTLPEHLVIYGGSYIALEFAQMYRRFGSRVTVIERGPHLLSREDTDISDTVLQILCDEGIEVHLNATIRSADEFPRHSHLLIATGRRPNSDDLGLEHTTIACDKRGYIQVDDELGTTAPAVWAIGDCNGKGAFTHTSYNDYEIVAANLLDHDHRRVSDRITAYAVYIDPPLGRAGMTDREIARTGRKVLTAKREMTRVGRAVEKGETNGFMKITVDAETRQILGAAILGVEGDEAIHCILDVMYARALYTVLQRAMHIHPTVSELIPTMLGDLQPRS